MKTTDMAPVGTPTLHYVPKWGKLSPSDQVEIYRKGQALTAGRVDVITQTGDMLWLFQDDGLGRVLFHKNDSVDIFQRTQHSPQEPPLTAVPDAETS